MAAEHKSVKKRSSGCAGLLAWIGKYKEFRLKRGTKKYCTLIGNMADSMHSVV